MYSNIFYRYDICPFREFPTIFKMIKYHGVVKSNRTVVASCTISDHGTSVELFVLVPKHRDHDEHVHMYVYIFYTPSPFNDTCKNRPKQQQNGRKSHGNRN